MDNTATLNRKLFEKGLVLSEADTVLVAEVLEEMRRTELHALKALIIQAKLYPNPTRNRHFNAGLDAALSIVVAHQRGLGEEGE